MKLSDRLFDLSLRLRGRLRAKHRQAAQAPIFVVGTGRSGTHWLGHILESHPELDITIEREPMFGWSKTMALDPAREADLFPRLIQRYQYAQAASLPRRYADKSHPNLWLAPKLNEQFPGAKFIGVSRGVYPVVASMLRHRGVLRSIEDWQAYPIPNRFLGITRDNVDAYGSLQLVERCALRWHAHQRQLAVLQETLEDAFVMIEYEVLLQNTLSQLTALQDFLGLAEPFADTPVKTTSLDKWRQELSQAQIELIDRCCADDAHPINRTEDFV